MPFNNDKNNEIKFNFSINTDGDADIRKYKFLIADLAGQFRNWPRQKFYKCKLNLDFGFIPNPGSELGIDLTSYKLKVKVIDYNKISPRYTIQYQTDIPFYNFILLFFSISKNLCLPILSPIEMWK